MRTKSFQVTWRWVAVGLALALPGASLAVQTNIRRNLRLAPGVVGLTLPPTYQRAVDEITRAAARNMPIPSSSAAYTYRFDPQTGTYEQTSDSLGPMLFMERPQTIGRYAWNLGVTGQYIEFDEYDGRAVGNDPNPVVTSAGTFLFSARPKIIFHMATVNVTYGLLDDLDVNVAVPLVAVDGDMNVTRQAPGGGPLLIDTRHGSVPLGVADVHVRLKYHLCDWEGWSTAIGLATRLPTGDESKLLGTGDAEIRPYLAASTLLWGRLEPHWNAGINIVPTATQRTSAEYAFGLSVRALDQLTLAASFLGRSELQAPVSASAVSGPHVLPTGPGQAPYEGVNFDRNDYFDAVLGAHVQLWRTLVLSVGIQRSLNEDGLRASDWSPLGSLQASF